MENVAFRVADGDKIGLVGRNGAGKTTLTKILAGDGQPHAGTITRSGTIGYLPQDPRVGDTTLSARDRILSVRGLDDALRRLREAEAGMQSDDGNVVDQAMKKYSHAEGAFLAAGGYAAESEAATIAASLGLDER